SSKQRMVAAGPAKAMRPPQARSDGERMRRPPPSRRASFASQRSVVAGGAGFGTAGPALLLVAQVARQARVVGREVVDVGRRQQARLRAHDGVLAGARLVVAHRLGEEGLVLAGDDRIGGVDRGLAVLAVAGG